MACGLVENDDDCESSFGGLRNGPPNATLVEDKDHIALGSREILVVGRAGLIT